MKWCHRNGWMATTRSFGRTRTCDGAWSINDLEVAACPHQVCPWWVWLPIKSVRFFSSILLPVLWVLKNFLKRFITVHLFRFCRWYAQSSTEGSSVRRNVRFKYIGRQFPQTTRTVIVYVGGIPIPQTPMHVSAKPAGTTSNIPASASATSPYWNDGTSTFTSKFGDHIHTVLSSPSCMQHTAISSSPPTQHTAISSSPPAQHTAISSSPPTQHIAPGMCLWSISDVEENRRFSRKIGR